MPQQNKHVQSKIDQPYQVLIAGSDMKFRAINLDKQIVSIDDILSCAGYNPAEDHCIVQATFPGTKVLQNDENVQLVASTPPHFLIAKVDCLFRFTIDSDQYEVPFESMGATQLLALAALPHSKVLLILQKCGEKRYLCPNDNISFDAKSVTNLNSRNGVHVDYNDKELVLPPGKHSIESMAKFFDLPPNFALLQEDNTGSFTLIQEGEEVSLENGIKFISQPIQKLMTDDSELRSLTPSKYLRNKRPELFSDSTRVRKYKVSRELLDHQLFTLTERDQHKDFENFCRKVAQREICPNLRPATGPEGGGDGKVDSETYPVSDEVALTWYTVYANSNKERWAFAFSAKKRWKEKLKSDVKKIISTQRRYDRIHFFTNQNDSKKKRLEIEDKLSEEFAIPITVYERNWLVDKTTTNDHTDLAYEVLGIGEYNPEYEIMGPLDTGRKIELDKLEGMIKKIEDSGLTLFTLVAASLRAAELSRELERPRFETEVRYLQAIRIADKHGTPFQQFLARYQQARTLLWYFDDLEEVHNVYKNLEEKALEDITSDAMELLRNILDGLATYQCNFINIDFQISSRSKTIQSYLLKLSSDKSRPNQSLHARTLLAINEMKDIFLSGQRSNFDKIFEKLTDILQESKGLGEFRVGLIFEITKEFANILLKGRAYDRFVEKVAETKSQRASEGEQGKVFLTRGCQCINSELPLEAIDWLGKAAIAFNKVEYSDYFIDSKFFLALAYAKANLNWAARATILSCLCTIKSISDKTGKFHHKIFSSIELFCQICLNLKHLPDALCIFHLLRLFETYLKVPESEIQDYSMRFRNLEETLTSTLISLDEQQLTNLAELPSILNSLGLHDARFALMIRLGQYEQLAKDDGITIEELKQLTEELSLELHDNTSNKKKPPVVILNNEQSSVFRTIIQCVDFELHLNGDEKSILIGEYLISGLEAFVANLDKSELIPHTNYAKVSLEIDAKAKNTEMITDPSNYSMTVKWPESWDALNLANAKTHWHGVLSFITTFIELVCLPKDQGKKAIASLEHNLTVERSLIFSNTGITHGIIFGKNICKLTDLASLSELEKKISNTPQSLRS